MHQQKHTVVALRRRREEEADKSEPTQTGGRPLGRRGVSRDTEIALELQRKVEIGVIM